MVVRVHRSRLDGANWTEDKKEDLELRSGKMIQSAKPRRGVQVFGA